MKDNQGGTYSVLQPRGIRCGTHASFQARSSVSDHGGKEDGCPSHGGICKMGRRGSIPACALVSHGHSRAKLSLLSAVFSRT